MIDLVSAMNNEDGHCEDDPEHKEEEEDIEDE
jgi:hypothetical protein